MCAWEISTILLGVTSEEKGNGEWEIQTKRAKGSKKYGGLKRPMKSKYVLRKTNQRIYVGYNLQALMHGNVDAKSNGGRTVEKLGKNNMTSHF